MRGRYQHELIGADGPAKFAALRRAVRAVFDLHDRVSAPWYLYAETAYGAEVLPHYSKAEAYQHAKDRESVPGENYVAVFSVADPAWPDPVLARYRGPGPEVAVVGASLHTDRQHSAYQSDLNREADVLFWEETHYKPGHKLDPHDPADQQMVPKWLEARERIRRSMPPRMLRQLAAVKAAMSENNRSHLPFYVFSSGPYLGEVLVPFADEQQAYAYVTARQGDSDYVAFFSTADKQHWPNPTFDSYQQQPVA